MGMFYEIVTAHRSALIVHAATGTVLNGTDQARAPEYERLTAFMPDAERSICLLFSRSAIGTTLKIAGQEFQHIIPLRALGPDASGLLSFYDPTTGLHLCAGLLDPATDIGEVSINRQTINVWERFTLRELPVFYVGGDVALLAERCEQAVGSGLNPETLIGILQRPDADESWAAVIEALGRLMPLPQVAAAAEWLMDTPDALAKLARIYPRDFDATVTLPRLQASVRPLPRADANRRTAQDNLLPSRAGGGALIRNGRDAERDARHTHQNLWRKLADRIGPLRPAEPTTRRRTGGPEGDPAPVGRPGAANGEAAAGAESPSAPETIGAELDFLVGHGCAGEDISFPHVCNALLRRSVHPARDLCVVATARNEGLYLLEWIAYHRLTGTQSFFLYSNDNSDGSDELLSCLHRSGIVNFIRNETAAGTHVQRKAYGHALSVLPEILDFRWALVIDIDEFFTFDPDMFGSARDYIAWQEVQSVHAIALNWIVMCSGGEVHWRDEPVIRRFTREIGGPALFIKTMCQPHRFIHSEPHFPATHRQVPVIFRNSDRDLHGWGKLGTAALSDRPVANSAWINHYFFKSAEEFLWKWARGRTISSVAELTNAAMTPDFVKQFVDQHVASAALPPAREAEAIRRCAPDLDAEIARLIALPGVADAAERVKENYRSRIAAIVDMFAAAPGVLEAGEAGERFLALFRSAPVAAEVAL